jgi:hypothetical protein
MQLNKNAEHVDWGFRRGRSQQRSGFMMSFLVWNNPCGKQRKMQVQRIIQKNSIVYVSRKDRYFICKHLKKYNLFNLFGCLWLSWRVIIFVMGRITNPSGSLPYRLCYFNF